MSLHQRTWHAEADATAQAVACRRWTHAAARRRLLGRVTFPTDGRAAVKRGFMKLCRATCAALAALFFFASPVHSTSFTTDQSDLWWVPNESGWGMQLVQRGSVIFATLFVYDPTGNPTWYTATLDPMAGNLTWTGDLYATTGPYFETTHSTPPMS